MSHRVFAILTAFCLNKRDELRDTVGDEGPNH